MKAFSILLLFFSSLAFSQSYLSEHFYYSDPRGYSFSDSLDGFEVSGKVKKITAEEVFFNSGKEGWNKFDSIANLGTDILEFTLNGKLESKSGISYKKKTSYLFEKIFFDESGRKIRKEEYSKDFSYVEKYTYDNNRLIEKWVETSLQTDFFLKERYTYNEKNLLIKQEDLNNNLRTTKGVYCKGRIPDDDTITFYNYNEDGSICKILIYKYLYKTAAKPLPTESDFKLYETYTIEFLNGKKMKAKHYGMDFQNYDDLFEYSTIYEYNKNGDLVFEQYQEKNSKNYSPFKKYYYKNNKLNFIEEGYHDNIISQRNYFDENSNLIRIEEIKKNEISDFRKFTDKGFLIQGKRDGILYDYKIENDSNGNWIKYSTYVNNVLIKQKQRIIEYYE